MSDKGTPVIFTTISIPFTKEDLKDFRDRLNSLDIDGLSETMVSLGRTEHTSFQLATLGTNLLGLGIICHSNSPVLPKEKIKEFMQNSEAAKRIKEALNSEKGNS